MWLPPPCPQSPPSPRLPCLWYAEIPWLRELSCALDTGHWAVLEECGDIQQHVFQGILGDRHAKCQKFCTIKKFWNKVTWKKCFKTIFSHLFPKKYQYVVVMTGSPLQKLGRRAHSDQWYIIFRQVSLPCSPQVYIIKYHPCLVLWAAPGRTWPWQYVIFLHISKEKSILAVNITWSARIVTNLRCSRHPYVKFGSAKTARQNARRRFFREFTQI